jgi:hypothetical protein
MCVLFYAMAKGSFRGLGRMFGRSHTLIYRWVREFGEGLPEPAVQGEVREIEFDEMWHFVESKKRNFGSSRPCVAIHGEPWPGCSAIVMLQLSADSTKR